MWKWLIILFLFLFPTPVWADTSVDITVTATGYVVGSPTGLTFVYVSDFEVQILWTKGTDAVNTMVRMAYGRVPKDRSDGYLVYSGGNESVTDTNVDFSGLTLPPYYRAWSQNAGGYWEEIGAYGEANFMSQSWMLLVFLGLALGLTVINFSRRNILMSIAASITWLALGIWLFFSSTPPLDIGENWVKMLAWVFFMMVFVPLLSLMDYEIKREGKGKSWTEWGERPKSKTTNAYDEYMEGFRRKLGSRRR